MAMLTLTYFTSATRRTILRFPAFLTESEGALIKTRLEKGRGELEMTTPTWKSMLKSAADWKVWEFSLYVLLNVLITVRL